MLIDDLLKNNEVCASGFDKGDVPAQPSKRVAIITCMDARIDVHRILGLDEGDTHVIRNGGGLVTEDALRSLVLSQRVLGTTQVIVIQHTGCGLLDLPEEEIKRDMERDLGAAPDFSFGGFSDLHEERARCGRQDQNLAVPHRRGGWFRLRRNYGATASGSVR